jgi:hypothetical protein
VTQERSVVLLLSDKRSGSTMFQRELCRHPKVQHVHYSPHTYFETHHWLKSACLLRLPHDLFSGGKRYGGYGPRPATRRYLVDCVRGNVPDFQVPASDEELVFSGWEALCDRFARPVFFEKSPQVVHHRAALGLLHRWIEQTAFQVKIVGIVRNPFAVMASAEKAFATPPQERQLGWLEGCRNLLEFGEKLGPDRFRLYRYEQIIENPASSFGSVCRYIGIEPADEIGGGVHSSSLNRWADDPNFTLRLDPIVRQMALELGYAEEDLHNPNVGSAPSMSVRGGRLTGRYKLLKARVFQRFVKPLALATWQRK